MISIIRLATPDDAGAIRDIYGPLVQNTVASFALEPPSVDEMRDRIANMLIQYPWLVCMHDGKVLGYVYGCRHRARVAYQWSVEVSVYVAEQAQRKGIARALYTSLFRILTLQGFATAYAGIVLPNVASEELHQSFGFEPVGVYRNVGYKLGAWHDVKWWSLALSKYVDVPAPPIDLATAQQQPDWLDALGAG